MMARVSVPFTEGYYCDRRERPNTELADNSPSICRKRLVTITNIRKLVDRDNVNKHNDYSLLNLPNQRYNQR